MIRLASRRLPRRPRKHACGHRWRSRSKPARRGSPTRAFARGTQRAWPRRRLHIHDDGGIERPSCHLARTTTTIEGTRAGTRERSVCKYRQGRCDKTRETRPPPCSSKKKKIQNSTFSREIPAWRVEASPLLAPQLSWRKLQSARQGKAQRSDVASTRQPKPLPP